MEAPMRRTMISALIYVLSNAVGLLVAALLVDGFTIDVIGFVLAAVLLSAVEAVAGPLILKLQEKNVPALQGGVALVTTFVGLWITDLLVSGMHIAGITALLASTLLVWLGTVIGNLVLPALVFKDMQTKPKA
jgi:uncharacterized membrane protein YvlD (DUF360 family)